MTIDKKSLTKNQSLKANNKYYQIGHFWTIGFGRRLRPSRLFGRTVPKLKLNSETILNCVTNFEIRWITHIILHLYRFYCSFISFSQCWLTLKTLTNIFIFLCTDCIQQIQNVNNWKRLKYIVFMNECEYRCANKKKYIFKRKKSELSNHGRTNRVVFFFNSTYT